MDDQFQLMCELFQIVLNNVSFLYRDDNAIFQFHLEIIYEEINILWFDFSHHTSLQDLMVYNDPKNSNNKKIK